MFLIELARYILLLLFSFMTDPAKITRGGWHIECVFRMVKIVMRRSENKPLSWLTKQDELFKFLSIKIKKTPIEQSVLAGRPCNWYNQEFTNDNKDILIYYHGGGFVFGAGVLYQNFCQLLADECQSSIILLDYRVAPDFQYPHAHDDCFNMTKQLLNEFPNRRFQLIGDSAGANILLACFQRLDNVRLIKQISKIILLSPWIVPNQMDETTLKNEKTDYLSQRLLEKWYKAYCPHSEEIEAKKIGLQCFPFSQAPALFVQYSAQEILTHQIKEFVCLARDNGVNITVDVAESLFHDYPIIGMSTPEGLSAIRKISHFISRE